MIGAFITHIQAEKRYSALTVRNYRHDIQSFATWCASNAGISPEDFNLTSVAAEDIREWIIYRMEQCGISPASMNRELSSLRSFFRFLRSHGGMTQDIFGRIKTLKTARKLPSFVPETRMQSLLESIRTKSLADDFTEQRNALIIALLYSCGLRLAELQGVRFGDLSADGTALHVRGKGDKHRIVPVLPEMSKRIARYAELLREMNLAISAEAPMIISDLGLPLSRSSIQRVVKGNLDEANVQGKKSPHVLRHTFATHLLNKEADMRDIQELMGHSSLKTTQCYTHNSIAQLQEVYKRAHPHK